MPYLYWPKRQPPSRRRRRRGCRPSVEPLEQRALLAILTVGVGGQFSTIQHAVDQARNNDEIVLYPGIFEERVDLSRLGSSLGTVPKSVIFRGTNGQSVIAVSNGAGVANSAPLATDLAFEGITFTATSGATNVSGIHLSQFQGDLSVIDSVFDALDDSGIVLRDADVDLTIEKNTFRDIGNDAGDHAIDLSGIQGIAAFRFNEIDNASDAGIFISNNAAEILSVMVSDNTVRGNGSFFATADVGLEVILSGDTVTDISLDRNTFEALAETAIAFDIDENAQAQTRWTRNVVSNINGSTGIEMILGGDSSTFFYASQNTIIDARNDGMQIFIASAADLRASLLQNAFLNIGDGNDEGHGLSIQSDASARGEAYFDIHKNDFLTISGSGLRIEMDGTCDPTCGQWDFSIRENFFSETNTASSGSALQIEQADLDSSSLLYLALYENVALDVADDAFALSRHGAGQLRLEGTESDVATQIAATNTGDPILVAGAVDIDPPRNIPANSAVLGGRVWVDLNGDGARDANEPGLEGVILTISNSTSNPFIPRVTQSDADGVFIFGGLVSDEYCVEIELPSAYVKTDAACNLLNTGTVDLSRDIPVLATWQNPTLRFDVNGDRFAAPGDVLVVINELNRNGARELTLPAFSSSQPPPFFDANGDGFLTSFDALVIINYLNGVGSGEGESVTGWATGLLSTPDDAPTLESPRSILRSEEPPVEAWPIAAAGLFASLDQFQPPLETTGDGNVDGDLLNKPWWEIGHNFGEIR